MTGRGAHVLQALTLPPNPKLSDAIGVFENHRGASFRNKPGKGQLPLRLTFFPVRDPTAPRAAIISMRPTHPLLALRSAEELYQYLESALPQITRFRELIPPDVAEAFVTQPAGEFPNLEACHRMFAAIEDAAEVGVRPDDAAARIPGAAVMVIGDAAHRFPPGTCAGLDGVSLPCTSVDKRYSPLSVRADTLHSLSMHLCKLSSCHLHRSRPGRQRGNAGRVDALRLPRRARLRLFCRYAGVAGRPREGDARAAAHDRGAFSSAMPRLRACSASAACAAA